VVAFGAGALALLAASTSLARPARNVPPPPNVLLIMVDDLKPTLGTYGDRVAVSPHIDALAARGVRFDRAYANAPVCAPSRMSLMLGSRSTSTGIYHFGMNVRDYYPNATTLPQAFMAAGYRAESIGKVYHTGHGTQDDRQSWSAPPAKDHVIEYLVPGSTPGGATTREEAYFNEKPYQGQILSLPRGAAWEMPEVEDTGYADGRTAQRAIRRLGELREDGKPFFLAVGFARPHLPFSVPRKYWQLYDPARLPMPATDHLPTGAPGFAGKIGGEIANYAPVPEEVTGKDFPPELTRALVHGYYAGVSYADEQIGKVLSELDRLGLAKNTVVVLWGDHGFHLGDHGLWTKHTNYEQASRIPLILAGPGIKPHLVSGQPAETVDLYPTLLQLAGLKRPKAAQPLDGLSLMPVIRDPAKRIRPYAYHAHPRGDRLGEAIRTERYRLVRWTDEKSGEAVFELYDMERDPGELTNIAAQQPGLVRKLTRYLKAQPRPVTVRLKELRAAKAAQ
jgi:iduronate 2-sulfatase